MAPVLRCADLDSALNSLAAIYASPPDALVEALPGAVAASLRDAEDPINALASTLGVALGIEAQEPETIHYFHGARAIDPERFAKKGLQPLPAILDDIWDDLGRLAPELSATDLERLRVDLSAGTIAPHTYAVRVNGTINQGPCGHLIRDALLNPQDYGSVDYLSGSEIPVDICHAVRERFGLDLLRRYREASTPCIVEFAIAPDTVNRAVASAAWYVEAGARRERTSNALWGHDGHGVPVSPRGIVSIDATSNWAATGVDSR